MTLKEHFISLVSENIKRDGIEDLMNWLETTDFYTAPASTRFHLSEPTGLLQHSLNVYGDLLRICATHYTEEQIAEKAETLAIIALFHDLCKVDVYKPEYRNVKVYKTDGTGKFTDKGGSFVWECQESYKFEEDLCYGFHGPKSVFVIQKFIKLTDEEAVCVANHMGSFDRAQNDYSLKNVFKQFPLAFFLHTADALSAIKEDIEEIDDNAEADLA